MARKTPPSQPWADQPYALLPIPMSLEKGVSDTHPPLRPYRDAYHETDTAKAQPDHSCLRVSSDMANAHNVLIRGLNAIVQQAPYVLTASEPGYAEQDVKDLLFYVAAWCKMVDHHHQAEERVFFPEIEKLTGQPELMAGALEQHAQFHGGLEQLLAYASTTAPAQYRWEGPDGMKAVIDGFGAAMAQHLADELQTLLTLHTLDSQGLSNCWDRTEAYSKQNGNLGMLYEVFPCALGNSDRTFEGSANFPPLTGVVSYAIKYWFAAGNGAFRFNPCDYWGQPRPLTFQPPRSGS